jgi:hypothetical protein
MRGGTFKLQHQQYCKFGLWPDRFHLILAGSLNFSFPIIIGAGQTTNEVPALSQMQTVIGNVKKDPTI